jgi:hypothetical protein
VQGHGEIVQPNGRVHHLELSYYSGCGGFLFVPIVF